MKASRGFTFIEVVTAMAIMVVLMPIAGIAFYQVMVTPPAKSADLAVTNEVQTLAASLYNDGHMADTFTVGTGLYYGNFSWTNNASNTSYFVSYYFTNDSTNGSHIARKVTATNTTTHTSKNTTLFLTSHIDRLNFSLSLNESVNCIVADMTAVANSSMGKHAQKQLKIYITRRPSIHFWPTNTWANDPIVSNGDLHILGSSILISGNVRSDGHVYGRSNAAGSDDVIDGTLACDEATSINHLSYQKPLIKPCNECAPMPDIGQPQRLFDTNLSKPAQSNGNTAYADEFVFPGTNDINLKDYANVWQDTTRLNLKPGLYYNGNKKIILAGNHIRGTVTFISDTIQIDNVGGDSILDMGKIENKIQLWPYAEGLLFWATGTGTTSGNSDPANPQIKITGNANWHPCVDLEGILFAPKGCIWLAGSGSTAGDFNYITPATVSNGALIAADVRISGDYWSIYRW